MGNHCAKMRLLMQAVLTYRFIKMHTFLKQWFHDTIAKSTLEVNMRKGILWVLFIAFVLVSNVHSQEVKLGSPTPSQILLNAMPAVPVAGNNLKFEFGGDMWISKLNGENFSAGSVETVDNEEGSILTLKQTHTWGGAVGSVGAVGGAIGKALGGRGAAAGNAAGTVGRAAGNIAGWKENPGSDIVLLYKPGPPESLSLQK
jgi:hypothetical protein